MFIVHSKKFKKVKKNRVKNGIENLQLFVYTKILYKKKFQSYFLSKLVLSVEDDILVVDELS